MSKRTGYVTIGGSIFGPDDTIPAELAKQVTNPKVKGATSTEAASTPAPDGGTPPAPTGDVPPKAGAGSGKDAWAAYAAAKGVDVAEDAKRDEIIAALDAANVPTEQ